MGAKPRYPWASATWWEVRYRAPSDWRERRLDRRRRSKEKAEEAARDLKHMGWEAWTVEVNRL